MRASKREELVQEALKVFYQNGFAATGMDMLVKKTGISKTSMYKHFRTKDDLILAALRLRDEQFRNWYFRRVEELGSTSLEQLLAVFDVLEEWFQLNEFQGCMFIKAASEFQCADHPIYVQCCEHKKMIFNEILKLVEGLKVDSGSLSGEDNEELTRQLLLIKEGAIVLTHMGVTETGAKDAKIAAIRLLQSYKVHGV